MSLEIRKIADDEPAPEGTPVPPPAHPPELTGGTETSGQGTEPKMAPSTPGPAPTSQIRVTWATILESIYGKERAAKILLMKRCQVCGGRLRPYTDPKIGSGSNRDYGVKPGLRCRKCGRMATL